jgi:hypothetical protein
MFTVIAIRNGIKSPPLRFRSLADAKSEADLSSRTLAESAIVYAGDDPRPRCVYQRGKLAVCRCPRSQPSGAASGTPHAP